MAKKSIALLFIAGIFFIILILAGMYQIFQKCLQESKRTAFMSTLLSLNAAIIEELESGNSEVEKIFSSTNEQW